MNVVCVGLQRNGSRTSGRRPSKASIDTREYHVNKVKTVHVSFFVATTSSKHPVVHLDNVAAIAPSRYDDAEQQQSHENSRHCHRVAFPKRDERIRDISRQSSRSTRSGRFRKPLLVIIMDIGVVVVYQSRNHGILLTPNDNNWNNKVEKAHGQGCIDDEPVEVQQHQ